MRFEELKDRLAGSPVFTVKDVSRLSGKPLSYARIMLYRLAKSGKVARVEGGKYCISGEDAFAVASSLIFPSYVSFLSALAFHHLTTQIPVEIQVACTRQKKPVVFSGMRITFSKLKPRAMFGFKRVEHAFVAEPEKAVVDSLYLSGKTPVSEVLFALESGSLDAGKLDDYAKRVGSAAAMKRLGFLMEKAGMKTGIAPRANTKTDFLNPLRPPKGERSAKWRLVINEVLE